MNNYLIKSSAISLIDKKIEELIREKDFSLSSINVYDLDEDSIISLIEDADTISFLTTNKVIIGKNLSNNNLDDNSIGILSKYLDNPNSNVLLILVTTNIDTRKKTIKEVINKLSLVNISTDAKIIVKDMLKDYNVEYRVIDLLEEYYSDDIERLISETKKLALAFIDTKNIVYNDAITILVKPLNKQDMLAFDLVREIALKNKKRAVNIYNELINYNIESYALIGLLESQYRLLYQVKVLNRRNISNNDIASVLEVHPFRVKKTLELVRYYTLKEIREIIKNLSDIDFKIKSGVYENNIIIDLLILNIKK
jgi:DNA polymerase III, delta subunit